MRLVDLTGKVFGKLTVLRRAPSKGHKTMWECACSCGNTSVHDAPNLSKGSINSCGCSQHVWSAERKQKYDITGKVFGKLRVVGRSHREDKKTRSYWECLCECGNTSHVGSHNLLNGNVKSCGCAVGDAIRAHHRRLNQTKKEAVAVSGLKACGRRGCLESNPQSVDNFEASKRTASGLSSACKACRRDRVLQSNYNITISEYRDILKRQGFLCCNTTCQRPVGESSAVDHCHRTGKVRGVLCNACNTALGLLRDSPSVIRSLAEYAERHKQLDLVDKAA